MAQEKRFGRLVARIERTPPLAAFAATMVPGIFLVVASYAVGLNAVGCNTLKLGYVFEVNWIWNFALWVPAATAFVFMLVSSARQAIAGMVSARMLVERDGRTMTPERANRSWDEIFARYMRWAAVIAVLGFLWSYWEGYGLIVTSQNERCGWFTASAAGAATVHPVSRVGNVVFGLLAYTMQGVGVAVFVLYFFTVIAFSVWMYRFTSESEEVELLPDTTSDDQRLGFQALEPLVLSMLYAGLAFFCVFFVTRIQFLFIAQTAHENVYDFGASELLLGMAADIAKIFKPDEHADFFAVGNLTDMSPMISSLALAADVALSLIVPLAVLRQVAQRSCARHAMFLGQEDVRVVGPTHPPPDAQRARLKRMRVWPVDYPKEVLLIVFGFTAAFTFLFYRLTFVLVAALAVASFKVVWGLVRGIGGAEKSPPAASSPPSG